MERNLKCVVMMEAQRKLLTDQEQTNVSQRNLSRMLAREALRIAEGDLREKTEKVLLIRILYI